MAKITRGQLVFKHLDKDIIAVTLGDPDVHNEAEHVLEIHKSFIPDLIAGLKAIAQQTNNKMSDCACGGCGPTAKGFCLR